MAGIAYTVDPTSEDASNIALTLVNNTTHFLVSEDLPAPPEKRQWASSVDTEGSAPAGQALHDNRQATLGIRLHGASATNIEALILAISKKVEKLRREGGTLQRTMPSGNTYLLDIRAGQVQPVWDRRFIANWRADLTLTFTAAPYWRTPWRGTITDDFSTDSIAAGTYAFDVGAGTLAVSGGQLVPSDTAVKGLYRSSEPDTFGNPTLSLKYTTATPVGTTSLSLQMRRLDANNRLSVNRQATALNIISTIGGVATTVATTAIALSAATSYWLRGSIVGNVVTAEHWTTDPALGGAPATTVTYTLTGADATAFGAGVAANVGLRIVPSATSERYDDLVIDPWVVRERTNPEAVLIVDGVRGDVPALGRLTIDEAQGVDQWFLMWGLQSRHYDSAPTAALAYAATALTALGTSAAAAGASGAFGSGSNVVRNTNLAPSHQAVLSTQATGGGSHLSHVGDFNVWARVYCPTGNTGDVKLALEWSTGDFRVFTRNAEWTMDPSWEGSWRLVNLGQVHIPKVAQGTQRWEGRVVARSTVAGDELDVNRVLVVPCSEGYGEARGVASPPSSTSASARDEFNQSAGNLNGKTAPVGGTWASVGSTTDLTVDATNDLVSRATTGDSGPRWATVPVTLTNTVVQADVKISAIPTGGESVYVGVLARYVDTSLHLVAYVRQSTTGALLVLELAGGALGIAPVPSLDLDTWYTLRVYVTAAGQAAAWLVRRGASFGAPNVSGYEAALTVGGFEDDGAVGIYDENPSGTAVTRSYDNLIAYAGFSDAAVFASQSARVAHDGVTREDSAGVVWPDVSDYRGDYLQIPPAGAEGRTTRLLVKASRNDPDTMSDPNTDDIGARLSVAERFIHVPE